ncbi:effector-associated domain EAD1-containing protein [Pseudomonas sp. ZB1P45]|uniref:GAP1-N1 domain-containing protein n=1 Tax=Pseudomonas frigoris TaxID=3398356 RepID=UPI0039EFD6FA
MWVEEAIYGEVKGGHDLRAASGNRQFALDIASRLDLPDTAPPGVSWSPYVSGFSLGDRYVIARTFIDTSAPRSGMVLSHALIMPLTELIEFQNLNSLFGRLVTSIDQVITPVGFSLEKDELLPESSIDLIGAANALTGRGSGPVVRLGTEGFELLAASIWASLWPEARANFGFRLSFGPADIVENAVPTLVCTPVSLAARWSRFRVLNGEDQVPASTSAEFLAGIADPKPILEFGQEIGADIQHLSQLPFLEQAHKTLSRTVGLDDFLTAIRLVEKLSPDSMKGCEKKKVIAVGLTAHVSSARPGQILSMRNLRLSGFPVIPELWQEVESWLTARHFDQGDDELMGQMIASATNRDAAVESWRVAVGQGIAAAARVDAQYFPRALWRWIRVRPELLDAIFVLLPTERSVELLVASSTPEKLSSSLGTALLQQLLARSWLAVHGAVLSALDCPTEAVRRQIKIDVSVADKTGIEFALRFASPAQVLECAVQLEDSRLIDLAADSVISKPEIFAGSQCSEVAEQKIWDAAIRRNGNLWRAPSSPFSVRDKVLEGLIGGGKIHIPLLQSLARTPLADLSDFARREKVWMKLEASLQREYLNATSVGWLRRVTEMGAPFAPDAVLKLAILRHAELDVTLLDAASSIASRVQIVEALEDFGEQRFLLWFEAILSQNTALPSSDVERLGQLVQRRGWQRVVDEMLARYLGHRTDLKPALRICLSMLGVFTRWMLNLSAPTPAEKWESFVQLAAELYPSGPDHDELWSRAGGTNSDLPKSGTGRSIWLSVIGQMRNGRGPLPARLLLQMKQDYPTNAQLLFIADDSDISGIR